MVSLIGILIALYIFPRFMEMFALNKNWLIKLYCLIAIILVPVLSAALLSTGK